ncbi:gliding motility-associated C-terminal domain-containing protein [Psychroserpens burtonensis]|uniref:Gliding motility-associated C-terminal domain-containing protein n=1 Tax=Psychroserpens burtonensis TaxID=49278 RepID=A0A5C7BA66_9FLAO|nr:gliding motility-associated C-terminal domain-containing protein [Psychroserpens burtonensis]TXE18352.1 gliding motility-associated C-terminal domain-containing protein [Psychroserpens burtonensis]
MEQISASTSEELFNNNTFIWSINVLSSNQSETLTVAAQISSSTALLNRAHLSSLNEPDRDDTNNRDDAEVTIDNCIYITDGLSPNNDGLNDTFHSECIEEFPDNNLKIYNRDGVQIYESNNYQNNWDGTANMGLTKTSNVLPVGVYFYILDLKTGDEPRTGWLYLNY